MLLSKFFKDLFSFVNPRDSVQNFMNKRSLDNDHENTILKRRRIKSEEETFIM